MTGNEVSSMDDAEYVLTIGYDIDTEDPTAYAMVEYMYDNSKTFDRDLMYCHICGEESDFILHDQESPHRAMMKIHQFEWHPRVVEVLANGYRNDLPEDFEAYELLPTDRNRIDRALVVVRETEYPYWLNMTSREQDDLLQSIWAEWKAWSDGDCYWGSISKVVRNQCGECDRKLPDEFVDSCGGFIGDVALDDWVKEIIGDAPVFLKEEY